MTLNPKYFSFSTAPRYRGMQRRLPPGRRMLRYLFNRRMVMAYAAAGLAFLAHIPQEIYWLWPSVFDNAPIAAVDVPSGEWKWSEDGCVRVLVGNKHAYGVWNEAARAEGFRWLPSRIIYFSRVRELNEGYFLSRAVYYQKPKMGMDRTLVPQTLVKDINWDRKIGNKRVTWEKPWRERREASLSRDRRIFANPARHR